MPPNYLRYHELLRTVLYTVLYKVLYSIQYYTYLYEVDKENEIKLVNKKDF